jgi:hypothetical protein
MIDIYRLQQEKILSLCLLQYIKNSDIYRPGRRINERTEHIDR